MMEMVKIRLGRADKAFEGGGRETRGGGRKE
jgi:hypothetical protein